MRKTKLKKEDCFLAIDQYYHKMKEFTDNDKVIIKLQGSLRRNILLKRIREQGVGVINRSICNNDEDFYTYTPKEEIEDNEPHLKVVSKTEPKPEPIKKKSEISFKC